MDFKAKQRQRDLQIYGNAFEDTEGNRIDPLEVGPLDVRFNGLFCRPELYKQALALLDQEGFENRAKAHADSLGLAPDSQAYTQALFGYKEKASMHVAPCGHWTRPWLLECLDCGNKRRERIYAAP